MMFARLLMIATLFTSLNDPKPPETKIVELTVSPKAAPTESFRLRLMPLDSERTPGDAIPIYLRLGAEQPDKALKEINDKSTPWLDGPIADLPIKEVRKFVESWSSRLKQMEFASRRRTADWNYTLQEQREEAISILLPDVQESRTWARLLAIKARLEIAEKNYEAAARTIESGLSMSRQIAEGQFLINGLVGIADANLFLNRVEELITQLDAPNLYWALTALPRPLVDLRKGMETEQILGFYILPEIAEPTTPRIEGEWPILLARLHFRWGRLAKELESVEDRKAKQPIPSLAKFAEIVLPEAKAFLKERGTSIDGMGNEQVVIRYIAAYYRESRDLTFRAYYLPYPEAVKFYQAADARRKADTGTVPDLFGLLVPSVSAAHLSEARLDRRVAALRTIEAIRMQAAADNGELPASLDKVTIVPVPIDPVTNRPFDYRVEGESRLLSAPGHSDKDSGLSFKITARKPR